jgi:hypothetical protein
MLLIEPLGFKPTFWPTYHALMIGYLSNFALPRLGEVTRCVTLGRREKIPVDSLFGTVIIERVIDLLMLLLIMLVLLLSWVEKFGAFFGEQVLVPLRQKLIDTFGGTWLFWLVLSTLILAALLLLYIFRKKLSRFSFIRKILDIFRGIANGLKTIYKMKRKWSLSCIPCSFGSCTF